MRDNLLFLAASLLCLPGCLTSEVNKERMDHTIPLSHGATVLACPPEAESCKERECVRFMAGFVPTHSIPDSCFKNVRTEASRFELDTLGAWSELLDDTSSTAGVFVYS